MVLNIKGGEERNKREDDQRIDVGDEQKTQKVQWFCWDTGPEPPPPPLIVEILLIADKQQNY